MFHRSSHINTENLLKKGYIDFRRRRGQINLQMAFESFINLTLDFNLLGIALTKLILNTLTLVTPYPPSEIGSPLKCHV